MVFQHGSLHSFSYAVQSPTIKAVWQDCPAPKGAEPRPSSRVALACEAGFILCRVRCVTLKRVCVRSLRRTTCNP